MIADTLGCDVISTKGRKLYSGNQIVEDYITSDKLPNSFQEYTKYLSPINVAEGISANGSLMQPDSKLLNLIEPIKWFRSKPLYSGSGLSGVFGLYATLLNKLSSKIKRGNVVIKGMDVYLDGNLVDAVTIVATDTLTLASIIGRNIAPNVNYSCYRILTGFDLEGFNLVKSVDQSVPFFDVIKISDYDLVLRSTSDIRNVGVTLMSIFKSCELINVSNYSTLSSTQGLFNNIFLNSNFISANIDLYNSRQFNQTNRLIDEIIHADAIINHVKSTL